MLLLLLRPGRTRGFALWSTAWRSTLSTTVVDGRLVADADRVAAQDPAVDDQGDLGDVGVRGAPVLLVRELDDGIGAVVQEPLEPAELALGVVADPLRDLDVLALDDRPHRHLRGRTARDSSIDPGRRPPAPSIRRGAARVPAGSRAQRASALAGDRDRRHAMAPPARAPRAQAAERRTGRHDVVDEEDPSAARRPRARGRPHANAPGHVGRSVAAGRGRTGRSSRVGARARRTRRQAEARRRGHGR